MPHASFSIALSSSSFLGSSQVRTAPDVHSSPREVLWRRRTNYPKSYEVSPQFCDDQEVALRIKTPSPARLPGQGVAPGRLAYWCNRRSDSVEWSDRPVFQNQTRNREVATIRGDQNQLAR